MEQALAAICHGLRGRHPLTLNIGRFGNHVGLAIDCPPRLISVVQQQVFAHYPAQVQLVCARQRQRQ
jgi:hypothetical protein